MPTGSHNSGFMPSPRPTRIEPLAILLLAFACGQPAATSDATQTTDAPATATTTATTELTGTTDTPTTGELADAGPCSTPLAPLARTSARLRVDERGVLRDEHGRDILLRGVNTGGRSKWAPFLPFPVGPDPTVADVQAAAPAYFARVREWGLDSVRVPFSWEALEPSEGNYDLAYLDRYVAMIDAAWAEGLRVIVDFHQDVYASPFCGDGFPLWTLLAEEMGPPLRDCENWGIGYIAKPGVRASFDRFWADAGGIQAKYRGMWQQMAQRVAEHPGVVGLELLNEPGWGTAPSIDVWKATTLNPFHTATIAWLRGLVGDGPIILFNNTGIEAVGLSPVKHIHPDGANIIYAPHLYDAGLIAGDPYAGNVPEEHIAPLAQYSRDNGLHALIGEFGVQLDAVGGEAWLTDMVDALDAHRVSGTLWEYSQNEALWNGEDLSLVDASGVERPIVDIYTRPYLRALAGTDSSFAWDPETRTATTAWTGDGGVTEVALPPRIFTEDPRVAISGPGACYTIDRERGELRIAAPAGATVDLQISAP